MPQTLFHSLKPRFSERPGRSKSLGFAPATVAGALICLSCGSVDEPARAPIPRDVLLITIDTLRADRLGAYGNPQAETPSMDRLAAEGRRFNAAFTPFPRTTPALATLHTGRWPQVHGSREVGGPLKAELPSLAQSLRTLGFRTVGVSANGAAGKPQGLAKGFDDFLSAQDLSKLHGDGVTAAAIEQIDRHAEAERLFSWVHYIDPHFPYHPWVRLSHPPTEGPCAELVRYARGDRTRTAHVVSNRDGRSEAARDDCMRVYDQEIAYTDFQIRLLLEAWGEARGGLGDTLVIVTSDHGENMGEWQLYFQHGPNVHDAGLRIPLIFNGPGIEPGVDDGLTSLEDLMPTLLSVLGMDAEIRPETDGEDLSLRLRGGEADSRRSLFAEGGSALLVESFRYITSGRSNKRNCTNGPRYSLCQGEDEVLRLYDHIEDPDLTVDLAAQEIEHARALMRLRRQWPPETARQRSVRQGRFKLVEVPQPQGGYERRLFDLQSDPTELEDVSSRHPEVMARLGDELSAWTAGLPSHQGLGNLSPEEEDQLRALGYID